MTRLDIDQPLDEQIVAYRNEADATTPRYVRDYYDGIQDEMSTITERENLGDRATRPQVENFLKRCTDTIVGRILFRHFMCDDDDVREYLKSFAAKNRYRHHVVANTTRVIVDGNNALSLSWKEDSRGGRVLVHKEQWWDGTEGMFVSVDDEGLTEWAVKEWISRDKRRRRTVYLPDRIIRQVSDAEVLAAESATAPVAWRSLDGEDIEAAKWTKRNGEPLGVPVVHFGNTVSSSSLYGRSMIAPLLGDQDALNGSLFDNVVAGAMSASPIYGAMGVSQEESRSLPVGPGQMWATANKDANFVVLGGQKLEGVEGNHKMLRQVIASQFPVPDHIVIGGDFPSGLALQKVESPMVSAAKLLGDLMASGHIMVAHRSTEIFNAFGEGGLNEDALIGIEYEPAEQLDEGTILEINMAKVQMYRDLATLPRTLMLKTGIVTEEEADAIIAERDAGFVELASMTEEV